jgi:hypothetical protein
MRLKASTDFLCARQPHPGGRPATEQSIGAQNLVFFEFFAVIKAE